MDFNDCHICGAPGGHGSGGCPRFNPYNTPEPHRVPAQWSAPDPIGPKLDRIIELLELIRDRQSE